MIFFSYSLLENLEFFKTLNKNRLKIPKW